MMVNFYFDKKFVLNFGTNLRNVLKNILIIQSISKMKNQKTQTNVNRL
jgi:recombination DNA repair RAD52 pathway protein